MSPPGRLADTLRNGDRMPKQSGRQYTTLILLFALVALSLVAMLRMRKVEKRIRSLDRQVEQLMRDGPTDAQSKSVRDELKTARKAIQSMERELEQTKQNLLSARLAEKVEQLVEGAADDQDRCLRLARWVVGHISNRQERGGDLNCFATRSGFCRARADLFVKMCALQHIPARVFNLYNFSKNKTGHSCAQAYYDGAWHFFDVTYGGVFIGNDKVLSWEQIRDDPERALAGMRVFEKTLDRWTNADGLPSSRVDNHKRMKGNWTVEALRRVARSAGFLRSPDVKWLRADVDLATLDGQLDLGQIDRALTDVSNEGIRKQVSSCLGPSLGTAVDTFHTAWRLTGGRAGGIYAIRYHLYDASHAGLSFWARSTDATLLAGQTFVSSAALAKREVPAVWEIRFQLTGSRACTIEVGFDSRDPAQLLAVDQIQIVPLDLPGTQPG